jgi:hypothetical protein
VAAFASEEKRWKVPPLADASCGATEIKIAKVTAKAMLRPLPKIRGAIMIVRSRKYDHDERL